MCRLFCFVVGCLSLAAGLPCRAQIAWPESDDPAKLRFVVRCEQVQYSGDRSQMVGHWIGPTDQPLIEELPGDAKAQRIKAWHGERAVYGVARRNVRNSHVELIQA